MLQNLPATSKWALIAASKWRLSSLACWDQSKDTYLLIFPKNVTIFSECMCCGVTGRDMCLMESCFFNGVHLLSAKRQNLGNESISCLDNWMVIISYFDSQLVDFSSNLELILLLTLSEHYDMKEKNIFFWGKLLILIKKLGKDSLFQSFNGKQLCTRGWEGRERERGREIWKFCTRLVERVSSFFSGLFKWKSILLPGIQRFVKWHAW